MQMADAATGTSSSRRPGDASCASIVNRSANLGLILLCRITTKAHHWHYEEEIRRFVPLAKAISEGGLMFWPFDKQLELVEVIVGSESSVDVAATRSQIRATDPDVVVFGARLAFQAFEVAVDWTSVPGAA